MILPRYKVIPGTGFVVDAFRYASPTISAYFLSHAHSDHYTGITEAWKCGIIYCSPVTASLVCVLTGVDPKFVQPLDLNKAHVVKGVEVTLVDANHCPGAVIFLFKLPDGRRYVHCGDMRYSPAHQQCPHLTAFRGATAVFLDTTYCHPKYTFPEQEESVNFVASTLQRLLDEDKQQLLQQEQQQQPQQQQEQRLLEEDKQQPQQQEQQQQQRPGDVAPVSTSFSSLPEDVVQQPTFTKGTPDTKTPTAESATAQSSSLAQLTSDVLDNDTASGSHNESGAARKRHRRLYLISTYVIGKERILTAVAERCGMPVHVTRPKLKVLEATGMSLDVLLATFTINAAATPVHVVSWGTLGEVWPFFRPNFTSMEKLRQAVGAEEVVGFVPTGWCHTMKGGGTSFPVRTKERASVYLVPYSEHSSFSELRTFVGWLRPEQVIPTVGVGGDDHDKACDKMLRHFTTLIDSSASRMRFVAKICGRDVGTNGCKKAEEGDAATDGAEAPAPVASTSTAPTDPSPPSTSTVASPHSGCKRSRLIRTDGKSASPVPLSNPIEENIFMVDAEPPSLSKLTATIEDKDGSEIVAQASLPVLPVTVQEGCIPGLDCDEDRVPPNLSCPNERTGLQGGCDPDPECGVERGAEGASIVEGVSTSSQDADMACVQAVLGGDVSPERVRHLLHATAGNVAAAINMYYDSQKPKPNGSLNGPAARQKQGSGGKLLNPQKPGLAPPTDSDGPQGASSSPTGGQAQGPPRKPNSAAATGSDGRQGASNSPLGSRAQGTPRQASIKSFFVRPPLANTNSNIAHSMVAKVGKGLTEVQGGDVATARELQLVMPSEGGVRTGAEQLATVDDDDVVLVGEKASSKTSTPKPPRRRSNSASAKASPQGTTLKRRSSIADMLSSQVKKGDPSDVRYASFVAEAVDQAKKDDANNVKTGSLSVRAGGDAKDDDLSSMMSEDLDFAAGNHTDIDHLFNDRPHSLRFHCEGLADAKGPIPSDAQEAAPQSTSSVFPVPSLPSTPKRRVLTLPSIPIDVHTPSPVSALRSSKLRSAMNTPSSSDKTPDLTPQIMDLNPTPKIMDLDLSLGIPELSSASENVALRSCVPVTRPTCIESVSDILASVPSTSGKEIHPFFKKRKTRGGNGPPVGSTLSGKKAATQVQPSRTSVPGGGGERSSDRQPGRGSSLEDENLCPMEQEQVMEPVVAALVDTEDGQGAAMGVDEEVKAGSREGVANPRPTAPMLLRTRADDASAALADEEAKVAALMRLVHEYDPVLNAPWTPGEPAPYMAVVLALSALDSTTKRLKMADVLTNMFRSLLALSPTDLVPSLYLLSGRVRPPHVPNHELSVGGATVSTALTQVTGTSRARMRELYGKLGDLGDVAQTLKRGQVLLRQPAALTVNSVLSSLRALADDSGRGASLRRVQVVGDMIRSCRSGTEVKYLVRTLIQNLRVGASWRSVLAALATACVLHSAPPTTSSVRSTAALKEKIDAAATAVADAYNVCPDFEVLVPILLATGPDRLSERIALTPGIPVMSMLARICTGPADACSILGDGAVLAEYKYDGQRAQIHLLRHGAVRIFSRNVEDVTSRWPDVIRACREAAGETAEMILDAELVAVDLDTDQMTGAKKVARMRAFQDLSTRPRNEIAEHEVLVDVCVFVFDIMYLEGKALLQLPLRERRALMRRALPNLERMCGRLELASGRELRSVTQVDPSRDSARVAVMNQAGPPTNGIDLTDACGGSVPGSGTGITAANHGSGATDNGIGTAAVGVAGAPDNSNGAAVVEDGSAAGSGSEAAAAAPSVLLEGREEQLLSVFHEALAAGAEGLVLKRLDAGSGYEPNKRSDAWVKLKKDYVEGLRDSLDLVPIGAWRGNGRKVQWFSPFLLAVYDPQAGEYQSVCRVMSGFTDEFYAAATQRLGAVTIPGPRPYYVTGESPDVWFDAVEVWEVVGAEVTLSPVHCGARGRLHSERGVGLRFPRFVRMRPDKAPEDASGPDLLVDLYQRQIRKASL